MKPIIHYCYLIYNRFKKHKTAKIIKTVKCKKSLYKSTYKGYAFTKGMNYNIVNEDSDFVYIVDNKNREFDIHKTPSNIFYYIKDYFN